MVHALSAASAGGIATLATHPFDVIKVCTLHPFKESHLSYLKTKLQVRNEERYRGFITTVVTLWKVCVIDSDNKRMLNFMVATRNCWLL